MALNLETLRFVGVFSGQEVQEIKKTFETCVTQEEREVLLQAIQWVKPQYRKASEEGRVRQGGHDFDHNIRTAVYATVLALSERKRPFIPFLTALLFDIGRITDDQRSATSRHGELSSEIIKPFLEQIPLLSDEDRGNILRATARHPLLNADDDNWLDILLKDADRLDTLGWIGLARISASRWNLPLYAEPTTKSTTEADIQSIYHDFIRVEEWFDMFRMPTARMIATLRIETYREFIQRYKEEAQANEEIARAILGK